MDRVVDEKGYGAGVILDKSVEEPWEFDSEQIAFAVELVNAEAEMLGADVEATRLTLFPTEINPQEKSYDLLTRPESRGVVSNIFHQFANESGNVSAVAITNLPGVGKSWTLFNALQQTLRYDGANMLSYFQKSGDSVFYLRRDDKIYTWTSTTSGIVHSRLFRRLDVLVLLDPREAKRRKFSGGR